MIDQPLAHSRRSFLNLGVSAAVAVLAWKLLGGNKLASAASAPFQLPDAAWRARLSAPAYEVLRHAATERPFSSLLNSEHRHGSFLCAGCALPLFASFTKFDSGTGWPSFYGHLPRAIGNSIDRSLGEQRHEVHCARCAGHLGHIFNDGPKPTGLRYCMNRVAMKFIPAKTI